VSGIVTLRRGERKPSDGFRAPSSIEFRLTWESPMIRM
jgi:hypothetical protein